ncbi:MAG: ORF6N domain-containing protein [Agriterribacter sp.]
MLDRDLATLYEVETRVFNQAVKRNIKRFPKDFMFQLLRTRCTAQPDVWQY